MLQAKLIATVVAILALLGGTVYIINDWHYAPIKELEATIVELEDIRDVYELKINNLNSNLTLCKSGALASDFEAYYEGGGGIESNTTNSTSNVFLKRVQ